MIVHYKNGRPKGLNTNSGILIYMQGNCNKAGRPRAEIPRVQMKTPLNFHDWIMNKAKGAKMPATDYMEQYAKEQIEKEEVTR